MLFFFLGSSIIRKLSLGMFFEKGALKYMTTKGEKTEIINYCIISILSHV